MKTKLSLISALSVVFVLVLSAWTWSAAPGDHYLPESKFTIKSMLGVNLTHHFATFRLHKGNFNGTPVYYVITDASDFGIARSQNINFAPKLGNMAIGCPECVQEVTLTVPPDNKFGEAIVNFAGIPDFSPRRILVPGPTVFPPAKAEPGAVGDAKYSPFIRIQGSTTIYNTSIVAVGNGPFDVVTHTNTADRVLNISPANRTVDILFVRGFDSGQPILYTSTEASDPVAAVIERAIFVPLLQKAPFLGGDDFLGAARERIFLFANGQTGKNNPQAQGLAHVILDGHSTEDASMANAALIGDLRNNGDSLNVQGDFPTLEDPRFAQAYSPLWDAQVGEWTKEAVAQGLNKRQTDENTILQLVFVKGLLTGPEGKPFGSAGFVINCPVIGFLDKAPTEPLVPNPLPD